VPQRSPKKPIGPGFGAVGPHVHAGRDEDVLPPAA